MKKRLLGVTAIPLLAWLAISCSVPAKEDAPPRVKANNNTALRELVGRRVTVHGKIESTGKSRSGHQFLNFYGGQVSVFCPSDAVAKFKEGPPAERFKNQEIEVTGTLTRYREKLQIKLTEPAQIKRLEPSRGPPAKLKPVELKQIGKETWLSPTGLRYQGRDPAGKTRVEHIERHARDIPERDGPHGVFDGGPGVAFAVIDEAWRLAEKNNLRARNEGDRSSYLVSMNRRVGYLGGQTGKAKNHPPLTKVFIVFETGTQNIITAFPR